MSFLVNLTNIEISTSAVLIMLVTLVLYYKWCFTYWKRRNVPLIKHPTIPFGTMPNPLFEKFVHVGIEVKRVYDTLKEKNFKHAGGWMVTTPTYFVVDPEYVKSILQKDFEYFSDRKFYYNEKDDPLSANMFAIGGEKWRLLRTQLSPAFTSVKIKMMFDNMIRCSDQMIVAVRQCYKNQEVMNVKDITESFTIDVIGSCGFGLECNSFHGRNAEFKEQGKRTFHMTVFRMVKVFLGFVFPELSRRIGVTFFDKQSNEFFVNVVTDIIKYRETHNIHRKDIVQSLMDLRAQQMLKGEDKIVKIEEITAQVFIFFAAGFETSSTTLMFCLYELALNEEIQEKVRNEINEVLKLNNGSISYDAIMDMKYMGQVIDESLRKYPPLPYLTRVCVKDYTLPGTNTPIKKGTDVVVSVLGLHHDPEYYPEPEKFIPERFAEKQKIPSFTYLPFGEGSRMCIGKKFGLLQTKLGLATLLRHFIFSLNEKTNVPLEIYPFSFTYIAKSGVFLDVSEIA